MNKGKFHCRETGRVEPTAPQRNFFLQKRNDLVAGSVRDNLTDMSDVTRGKFLKELGRSLPGMLLGSGIAGAAHKVLGKVAAVSNAMEERSPAAVRESLASAQPVEIPFIRRGPVAANRIALTFDDGPTPGVTDPLLDELKRHHAKATFFMIGNKIAAAPELARRVLDEGHEVGNHTFTHAKLTELSDAQVSGEIEQTHDAMAEVLRYHSPWFRPPFGALRQNQAHLLAARGLDIILWDVDSSDWSQPGVEKISGQILADTKAGSIIVCHDLFAQTVESIKIILPSLAERGLVFSTLSQLLR